MGPVHPAGWQPGAHSHRDLFCELPGWIWRRFVDAVCSFKMGVLPERPDDANFFRKTLIFWRKKQVLLAVKNNNILNDYRVIVR
jgi:hypothetical protein